VPESLPTPEPPTPTPPQQGKSLTASVKTFLYETLTTILPALVLVLIINVFLGEARRVEMQSMEPNLYENQRLIIEKISYRLHRPQRGDIIVLRLPNHNGEPPLIKRVIGLPGEIVEIRGGQVYINGKPLTETYLTERADTDMAPCPVPANSVFVLGDNRPVSNDSRYFGPISDADIIGRACFRYWPLSQIGPVN